MRWSESTERYLMELVERFDLTPERVERTRELAEQSAAIRGSKSVSAADVAVGSAVECDEWLNPVE